MSVDDSGLEVLKKAAHQQTPGDKSEYTIAVFQSLPPPTSNPSTPTIYNVPSPATPDTEFSQALAAGTQALRIRCREISTLKFAFVSGQTSTNFITIPFGTQHIEVGLNLTGVTLYLSASKANVTVEILQWT